MASQDQHAAIAQVWAEALLGLAAGAGREDELLAELEGLAGLFAAEPALEAALAGPLVEDEAKRALVEKALRGRTSDLLADAVQVLRRKGRLGLVRAIARAYRELWTERKGRVEVSVTSVVPLAAEVRAELLAAARRRTGREPLLVEKIDPALIGGLVIRIEDHKYDGSVAGELAKLERYLLERGKSELIEGKTYFTEETEAQ